MVTDYIKNGQSLPGNTGYDAPQSAMCEFMNYCHGNGHCDTYQGTCDCYDGFDGQDCSINLAFYGAEYD